MPNHMIATRTEFDRARRELLDAEKELTQRHDQVAELRRALPWVRVEADYLFDTEHGERSLVDLFDGRSQLIVW